MMMKRKGHVAWHAHDVFQSHTSQSLAIGIIAQEQTKRKYIPTANRIRFSIALKGQASSGEDL